MAKGEFLGEFEQLILLAVLRLGDDAYGVTIRREIEECGGRESSLGAVYTTLDRLEQKGWVESRLSDPTPERGGRSKRLYRPTAQGIEAVRRTQETFRRLTKGLRLLQEGSSA